MFAAALLFVADWDNALRMFSDKLDSQAERTQATLFRLGELMSIGAAYVLTRPDR